MNRLKVAPNLSAQARAGVVPFLVQLCRSPNSEVQVESADVLKVLARNRAAAAMLVEAGAKILTLACYNPPTPDPRPQTQQLFSDVRKLWALKVLSLKL